MTGARRVPVRFRLDRHDDTTGISGVGVVAYGVRFADGVVVLRWCTMTGPHSTTMFGSVEDLLAVHGHAGATEVVWLD